MAFSNFKTKYFYGINLAPFIFEAPADLAWAYVKSFGIPWKPSEQLPADKNPFAVYGEDALWNADLGMLSIARSETHPAPLLLIHGFATYGAPIPSPASLERDKLVAAKEFEGIPIPVTLIAITQALNLPDPQLDLHHYLAPA